MKGARAIAWKSQCPDCNAAPGTPCIGKWGQQRKSVHRSRYSGETQMGHGEKFEQYVRDAAQAEAVRYEEEIFNICERCESPIEALLLAALHAASKIGVENIHFMLGEQIPKQPYYDETAFIFTQVPIGEYRADIVVLDATLPFELGQPRLMIVECDGHEYHERTKEQARRDKRRDRYFQGRGYKVLRFTGSEIWADPDDCAAEIMDQFASNDHFRNRDK